ncbi:hypothetical protein BOO92_00010 [Vibrio navarrensis]|uniref:hypothetical protein n=1 Tax=Vibrio navarrensis TaxID=29495 RepID=UPI00186968F5|nr:hypothetical protein [Vibrio navarrensis]MBE3655087.1 hypothetical protein [Vibrio navarrensis]
MLVFGHKTSNDNVIKEFLFKKLVNPLLSFLTAFCAPSYGMILGFTILMLLFGNFDYALGSFLTSIIVLCYVMLSELVRYIANNGFGEEVSLVKSRLASALFLLVTPALYLFIAEPAAKCVG